MESFENRMEELYGKEISKDFIKTMKEISILLEVKFDSRNSIFDSDNKKYSINLYLIPKANGTSNLEVIFKDDNSGKQTKYLYKVIIDDNLNTTYKLSENN